MDLVWCAASSSPGRSGSQATNNSKRVFDTTPSSLADASWLQELRVKFLAGLDPESDPAGRLLFSDSFSRFSNCLLGQGSQYDRCTENSGQSQRPKPLSLANDKLHQGPRFIAVDDINQPHDLALNPRWLCFPGVAGHRKNSRLSLGESSSSILSGP
ncbi:hypothetical protein BDW74DRAFT_24786 [Aspergillus multicolor]|uniref:uncharacterized protein n=1 Tax=Aspergillus multicolor TaxID=41759 RepID=UPI003CCDBCC1